MGFGRSRQLVRWSRRAAWAVVIVGLAVRLAHYLSDPSVWFDEASLMLNVLDKGYAELLGPLDHAGNGPPLFLWLEKALVSALGDRPLVWRLPSLLASCGTLVVLAALARRVLPAPAVVLAVAPVAFSDRFLWHTAEVKPYALDAFLAVGAVAVAHAVRGRPVAWRLGVLAVAGPVLMGLSFPAAFVCAGLWLVLAWEAWRTRRGRDAAAAAAAGAVLAATAVLLAVGPVRAQHRGIVGNGFTWTDQMPDYGQPALAVAWPAWSAYAVLRYGLSSVGGLLLGFAVVGGRRLYRRGRGRLLAILLLPFAVAVAASYAHRYPTGFARTMLFLAPAGGLLVGAGAWDGLRRLATVRFAGRTAASAVAAALVVVPMGYAGFRLARPWPRSDCRAAAAYILEHRRPTDPVTVNAWDQIYFFRGLDACYRRSRADLARGGPDERVWAVLHVRFDAVDRTLADWSARGGWTVSDWQAYSELVVVRLDRSPDGRTATTAASRPRP